MTEQEREFLNKINDYAEQVSPDFDPEKMHVSEQLEKLRPIMQQLAMENSMSVEDVFIKYMDLHSEAVVEAEKLYKAKMGPDVDLDLGSNSWI